MTRFCDIILSFAALLLLSPLFVPIILILVCTGEGKIFYKQQRVGKNNKTFRLLKFATMLEDSPNLPGGDITIDKDPRVLPFGKFLRKTKINELPQLINILNGQISIIGPRPLTLRNFKFYDQEKQKIISTMRPGLSGIGSIVFRDEQSIISMSDKEPLECYREDISPYKGELEKWYAEKRSIYYYFILIFSTLWVVIFPKSSIIWKIFDDLPVPPDPLKKFF